MDLPIVVCIGKEYIQYGAITIGKKYKKVREDKSYIWIINNFGNIAMYNKFKFCEEV